MRCPNCGEDIPDDAEQCEVCDASVAPELMDDDRESLREVIEQIEEVAETDASVLILGETGTGKELAAEALHQESPRSSRPLIKVDCTAIPENLLESELFGHKKGSFTGADKDRKGLLLQADGGTLFLDEIGEISPMTQLRLLRFLQERTFYPVGSDTPIVVDTRIITATNVDLKEKVQSGSFREDLYFRLKVIDLILPPLRKRMDDVPLLVNHFLQSVAYPEIFGGGDCISFEPQPLAKVGVYAVRQNPILLHNLLSTLNGHELQQFVPQKAVLLALNMGDGTAIVDWHSMVWGGRLGFALKDYIDRKFMKLFQVSGELG